MHLCVQYHSKVSCQYDVLQELLHMLQECNWHLHMKKDMIGNLALSGTVTQPKDWTSTLSSIMIMP